MSRRLRRAWPRRTPPARGRGRLRPPAASLRDAHAVELAHEGVPLNIIQRRLGHTNLGVTSQGRDGARCRRYRRSVSPPRPPNRTASTTAARSSAATLDAAGTPHGFLRGRDGEFTTIDLPDALATAVFDLNDRGQMVGIYLDDGGLNGFRRDPSGEVTTIDAPGATQTRVRGINNRGEIAIDTVDGQLRHHSFLLDRGRFTEIRPRGARSGSLATDVDNRGRVLGYVL